MRPVEPQPAPGSHVDLEQQTRGATKVTKRGALARLPPVFGTAQPPRFASGLLRRFAYRIPEHKARHWMLLLFADKVDVLEHRAGAFAWRLGALGAAAAGVLLVARSLRARALLPTFAERAQWRLRRAVAKGVVARFA